jgi:trk system potassium uptake protein TrkA
MNIVIMGMGTLGKFLASTFCNDKHDVTVIDLSHEALASVRKRVDVMTVAGNAAFIENLDKANIEDADFFIAAGSDDTANIHACNAARTLGAEHVVCRLSTERYFDESSGLPVEKLGIDHVVVPQKECVTQIIEAIDHPLVLERIAFNVPDASITAFKATTNSPLIDTKLKEFPEPKLIASVRFAAIVRNEQLIAPKGDTLICEGDEIYIAGKRHDVNAMIEWATPPDMRKKRKRKRVIIAGCSKPGLAMLRDLATRGYDVRMIEKDEDMAEAAINELNAKMIAIHGDASDGDVLDEAGVSETDVFVAMGSDDESNILSCILAKRMGADKVIAVTNKEEYSPLIRQMKMVDCDFSTWLVAGNSTLRHVSSINRTHTRAMLHRAEAFVSEFILKKKSSVIGKQIDKCDFPESTVLSLVFRNGQTLIPSGDLVLETNDIVTAITTQKSERRLVKLFK